MHPLRRAQITYLKIDKAPTKVPSKYASFANVFSPKLTVELFKQTGINNYTIKLVDDWQSPYSLIYKLGLIELKTLKTYIKNNLTNSFIKPFKYPATAFILFDKKLDGNLQLCVNYWCLNNLIIKNCYILPLVRKSLGWLNWSQHFT